ncbi:hypothetical protein [Vibrio barjaei]|uniref:hypothetical protein n=1 Tax=Vibrio barjaei TaxID=1676683 RepID=UPI002284A052|nr:hypothetical protein [Vibrio barjaei]MCY9874037.1 hypothetical protein [Vibrio barjaei]
MTNINWVEIDTSMRTGNTKGITAKPPTVSVNGSTFTMNNRAIIALTDIHGSHDFSLRLFISDCGNHIGVKPKKPEFEKTGINKSITSREARLMLNAEQRTGPIKVLLTPHDDMLIGSIELEDRK